MNYLKIFLFAIVCLSFPACWSTPENTAVSENVNTNTTKIEQVETADGTEKENSGTIDEKLSEGREVDLVKSTEITKPHAELSPTEVLIGFAQASNAHNAANFKKYITRKSLEFFKADAAKQGMTVDELIEKPSQMPTVETPKFRNEKINGDTATVEAENMNGSFDEYPLVKEDGVWKVDFDKFLRQQMEKINQGGRR